MRLNEKVIWESDYTDEQEVSYNDEKGDEHIMHFGGSVDGFCYTCQDWH